MRNTLLVLSALLVLSCNKDDSEDKTVYSYSGTYSNFEFTESLIKEFTPGIYLEAEIPAEIPNLKYGRIEIDFRYNGGGSHSFMPLFYYGSINKNPTDNAVEEPGFHMAIEIGHYNVIPDPVDFFFYTICTYKYPRYCRDSFWPVITGIDYTFVMDKRPDGILIQLKQGEKIINSFAHAYFPDSTQMFFKDVTSYTEANKGDSLQKTLMVGYGFAGIEPGIHQFNGNIPSFRIYGYSNVPEKSGYELENLRNQHCENEFVKYSVKDKTSGTDKYIRINYDYWPYKYETASLIPNGEKQTIIRDKILNNTQLTWDFEKKDIGFYQIYIQTLNKEGDIIHSTTTPFNLWVYPKEWEFEY